MYDLKAINGTGRARQPVQPKSCLTHALCLGGLPSRGRSTTTTMGHFTVIQEAIVENGQTDHPSLITFL